MTTTYQSSLTRNIISTLSRWCYSIPAVLGCMVLGLVARLPVSSISFDLLENPSSLFHHSGISFGNQHPRIPSPSSAQREAFTPEKPPLYPGSCNHLSLQCNMDVDIFPAQHCHVGAMAHVFINSFDLDGSVKLMYTKDEIWPVIQAILHDYMNDPQIDFRLAVARDSGLLIGWMSFGIIGLNGQPPQFAFNEMTSWATQRLLRAHPGDLRYRLAAHLEDRSRHGQNRHTPMPRLVINTLVTDPDHRRAGVATTLLRVAVDRARGADDWAVWVQAPSVYVRLFWRAGFYEVGAFGLDLNAFKPPAEAALGIHGRQLGVQTWRQMKLGTRAEALLQRAEAARVKTEAKAGQMAPDVMGAGVGSSGSI